VKHVQRADGSAAIADDMPPATRAVCFLLEHANQRREAGLSLPCPCAECQQHRGAVRCSVSEDGQTLIVEAS
jgi:hypothetical protein